MAMSTRKLVAVFKPNNPFLRAFLSSLSNNYKFGGVVAGNVNEESREGGDGNEWGGDASKDTAGKVAEVAKAMDSAVEMGDNAKETADNAWDAAKETSKNIKEATMGDSKDNGSDVDKHIKDLRRRDGGYDFND